MSKSTKTAAVSAASSDLMYVGPTIVGVIRHSTVFKDGKLPKAAEECIAQFPAMRKLFVSTDGLAEAVKELNKKQSALGAIYAEAAKLKK